MRLQLRSWDSFQTLEAVVEEFNSARIAEIAHETWRVRIDKDQGWEMERLVPATGVTREGFGRGRRWQFLESLGGPLEMDFEGAADPFRQSIPFPGLFDNYWLEDCGMIQGKDELTRLGYRCEVVEVRDCADWSVPSGAEGTESIEVIVANDSGLILELSAQKSSATVLKQRVIELALDVTFDSGIFFPFVD